ncbi:MAG: RNA methyltransferase [Ruminococcus sp.]|nr:RNA methyltransferase [Candidatus Apopatosoma intestinale]
MTVKESDKFATSDVMEGMISIRAVLSAMESGENDRRIERVVYDRARARAKAKELSYLRAMSYLYDFPVEEWPTEEIKKNAIGSTHGGILAFCTPRTLPVFSEESIPENGFFVMLEGIEDPYNFGYCLRSLWAAGVSGVILERRNWTGASGVVARASAGASERCPLFISDDFASTAASFRAHGYTVAAADKNPRSKSVYDADLRRPLLLIVGGERRGSTAPVLHTADVIVELSYGRDFREALSAASAATVLAFEVFRQNRENDHGPKTGKDQ